MGEQKESTFKQLVGHGMKAVHGVFGKDDVCYIPTGWLIAERVRSGPLVYGVRKSFFIHSTVTKSNYSLAVELLAASGSNVSKMNTIESLISDTS